MPDNHDQTEAQRAKFEAAMREHWPVTRDADGEYSTTYVRGAWVGWLASVQSREGAAPTDEGEAWVPCLSDRADGVRGHYAICRWNPGERGMGYHEAWNLRSHAWTSCSDEVLTLEQATTLLRNIVIPSRALLSAGLPVPQQGSVHPADPVLSHPIPTPTGDASRPLEQEPVVNPTDDELRAAFRLEIGGPNPFYLCNSCGSSEPGERSCLAAHWRTHHRPTHPTGEQPS